jgi:outer membrane protein TolC
VTCGLKDNPEEKVKNAVNTILGAALDPAETQRPASSSRVFKHASTVLVVLVLLLNTAVSAQTLTFPEALAQASKRTAVLNAQLELDDARTAEGRTVADPLALRPERTQAAQRLEFAVAALEQARYEAQREVAQVYMQVLQAHAQVVLAEHARDLSQQALDIARIRVERGSATDLDVREAETALEEARNALRAAREGLNLARTSLQGLLGHGELGTLEPVPHPDDVTLSTLRTVLANLERHPQLLELAQGYALAAMNVELLDPSYAPRVQIDSAKLQLEQAERFMQEARRGFELQARSLYNEAQTAAQTWAVEETARAHALTRLEVERQRHVAGLIADIQLRQAELAALQAELVALQAKHAYVLALLELQAGTLTPVEGLHDVAIP